MLSVNPTGSHCVFTIGDHVFEVPTASARALGKFLDENSAAGIWENADPVIVADWRFEAARDARWQKPSKLDDSGAVWDLITRLEQNPGVLAYDVELSAKSSNGEQIVDYSGSLANGYGGAELKTVAGKLQDIVQDGTLRMEIGNLGFSTGQALIDWLNATNEPFNLSYVSQD